MQSDPENGGGTRPTAQDWETGNGAHRKYSRAGNRRGQFLLAYYRVSAGSRCWPSDQTKERSRAHQFVKAQKR